MPAPTDRGTSPESGRASVVISRGVGDSFEAQLADRLQAWLAEVLREDFAGAGGMTVVLQTDEEIAALNRRFRERPHPTDVLSFPGGDAGTEQPYLGDVAISVETAARQAASEGHALFQEIRLLALHGLLHCAGYDHETDDGEMDGVELDLRDRWLTDDV